LKTAKGAPPKIHSRYIVFATRDDLALSDSVFASTKRTAKVRCVAIAVFVDHSVPLLFLTVKMDCSFKEEFVRFSFVICILTVKAESFAILQSDVIKQNILLSSDLFEIVSTSRSRIRL